MAKIIILTTFEGDEDVYRCIRAGAKAYLLKGTPRNEILNCIQTVHAGQSCLPASIATKLTDRVSGVELTEREVTDLRTLATRQSNKEIGAALFIKR